MRSLCAFCVACVCLVAQNQTLPVKRVVLYKNGVGYFEHIGKVRGNQDVTVSLTSGQLNDVLKSLTVLDLNGGKVSSVSYDSTAPVSKQLADLHLPVGEKTSLTEFLAGLRGAKIEARNGTAVITGRLLSVERKTRISGGTTLEVDYIALVTDNGEVRTTEVSPAFSVRLLEPGLPGKVGQYLDLVSAGRAPDVRNMVVATEGSGERSLFVSYISETPVWKSTYRLVLGKKQPLLQGWAIVDNTVGQDWKDVKLSLVAGAPQSFVQNLSAPFYSRRPVVGIPEALSAAPQTFESTLTDMGSRTDSVTVTAEAPTIQAETATVSARKSTTGSGRALGVVGGVPGGVPGGAPGGVIGGITGSVPSATPPPPPRNFEIGGLMAPAAASAQALGDLFEYALDNPITIDKNRSALVPIVHSSISAEKVSIWNDQSGLPRPRRGLWLVNSTGLTLDGGTFSVLEDETFAGEGVFDPIRPDEKRLVSYAIDLALTVSSKIGTDSQRVSRVVISKGVMRHDSEAREKKTYTFRNADSTGRSVIVEHPVRQGYELRSDVKPVETSAQWMRFRLPVDGKQTASLVVDEARVISSTYMVSDLRTSDIDLFLSQGAINRTVEESLRRILAQKNVIAEIESKKSAIEDENQSIFDDQQRLRENMRSLKGSTEEKLLIQRYTQQLNQQETKLEDLRKQSADLEAQLQREQQKLDRMVQELSFDVKL